MIYADHNATAPLRGEVREAMLPWLDRVGNPASVHRAGQTARMAVERAREQVAALIGGNSTGVVFTSGATEANHTALLGAWQLAGRPGVVASPIEHPCVQACLSGLEARGARVERWAVGADGVVLVRPISPDVGVVSLMAANHETGVIQPIERAWEEARSIGAFLHVDATQAAGRIPLQLSDADAVVLSSHKLGGPGGVGALVLRNGDPFPPLLRGGAQERGRRSGTVNIAGVVGFGEACRVALRELDRESEHVRGLSEQLWAGLRQFGARRIGCPDRRLPNTTTVVFPGLLGESLVQALDIAGVCVSSGAACASGSVEPSPVLVAMGDPEPAGGVRFSLGRTNTAADIDAILSIVPGVLESVRWAQ